MKPGDRRHCTVLPGRMNVRGVLAQGQLTPRMVTTSCMKRFVPAGEGRCHGVHAPTGARCACPDRASRRDGIMTDDKAASAGSADAEVQDAEAGSWLDVFELIGGLFEIFGLFA